MLENHKKPKGSSSSRESSWSSRENLQIAQKKYHGKKISRGKKNYMGAQPPPCGGPGCAAAAMCPGGAGWQPGWPSPRFPSRRGLRLHRAGLWPPCAQALCRSLTKLLCRSSATPSPSSLLSRSRSPNPTFSGRQLVMKYCQWMAKIWMKNHGNCPKLAQVQSIFPNFFYKE